MDEYLQASDIIDYDDPAVTALAERLAVGSSGATATAQRCFEWVRDEIAHSFDVRATSVTCSASEVLREGAGICHAKSHLLAALLRANDIPAGMCYQRLSRDGQGAPFCLHGLNGVFLEGHGWYRIDPRGNRGGIDAQFGPPVERLAYPIRLEGEADLPDILPSPLPIVVDALRSSRTTADLRANLPDVP